MKVAWSFSFPLDIVTISLLIYAGFSILQDLAEFQWYTGFEHCRLTVLSFSLLSLNFLRCRCCFPFAALLSRTRLSTHLCSERISKLAAPTLWCILLSIPQNVYKISNFSVLSFVLSNSVPSATKLFANTLLR